ncbi:MAG TPA: hypothetical protein VK978_00985 [Candidatus Saccharimonadales bacterium]|nr:hypothetical protein [Candidatus Saccharimonadales bacterium]
MRIGEYTMESPLMNAGGLVKTVADARLMARTAVGAILPGSYTLEPRAGNGSHGERVYYHDPTTGITYNSLGMPNCGMAAVADDLPEMIDIAHDHGKPLIFNFAPVTSDPIGEVIRAFEILEQKAISLDGFELNASCPNVVIVGGARHEILSAHPGLFGDVAGEISDISVNKVGIGTIIARISPFGNPGDEHGLVVASKGSLDAFSGFNTFPGGRPRRPDGSDVLEVPGGIGGQSGPGMTSLAEAQTVRLLAAIKKHDADIEVIGSNGIADAGAMKRRLDLGVSAVSATTLFWEAQSWAKAADKLLRDYAELQ